jgi:putative endopeptidase
LPRSVLHGFPGQVLVFARTIFAASTRQLLSVETEAALRGQLKSDIHPPGEYRSDTVRNIEAWYKAFNVTSGDKLYLKPDDRVAIW